MSVWAALKDKFRTDEQCVEISCDDFKGQVPGKIYPPDRAQIGVAAWRYLHAMAANHPEQPTPAEQADAQRWLAPFMLFFDLFLVICLVENMEVDYDNHSPI